MYKMMPQRQILFLWYIANVIQRITAYSTCSKQVEKICTLCKLTTVYVSLTIHVLTLQSISFRKQLASPLATYFNEQLISCLSLIFWVVDMLKQSSKNE